MDSIVQLLGDLVGFAGSCLPCGTGAPTLRLNGRSFRILRLLGEGGFSYVYLVQDTASHSSSNSGGGGGDSRTVFALKKIRCPFGTESVQLALREVEAYRTFAHVPGIIHSFDHAVVAERGGALSSSGGGGGGGGNLASSHDGDEGSAKTVYILLPYYERGNLQDAINANVVNHARFPERKMLILFLGVCKALKGMHQFRPPSAASPMEPMSMGNELDIDDSHQQQQQQRQSSRRKGKGPQEEETLFDHHSRSSSKRTDDHHSPLALSDEQDEAEQQRPLMANHSSTTLADTQVRSFAHRDIKPGNIMIDDSGSQPILMDLGSVVASPLAITSSSMALAAQDAAAEHSTMPYRAPELFDVQTGMVLDTKVDIWSLGCTLFACLVGKSPFELRSDETGGSLSLCIQGGDWRFPDEGGQGRQGPTQTAGPRQGQAQAQAQGQGQGQNPSQATPISEPIREIVRRCLRVEPVERPDIDELISLVEAALETVS